MTNHYHVVVETIEGNLSKGMRHLNGVYTQNFNRRHKRVGHVFQGRYNAILVEKDNYLLELSRYVVLNPVRARMVNDAGDWPWSSYLAMTDQAAKLDCLLIGFELNLLWKETKPLSGIKILFAQVSVYHPYGKSLKIKYSLEIKPLWKKCKVELKPEQMI